MIMPRRRPITLYTTVLCGNARYHAVGERMGSGIGRYGDWRSGTGGCGGKLGRTL